MMSVISGHVSTLSIKLLQLFISRFIFEIFLTGQCELSATWINSEYWSDIFTAFHLKILCLGKAKMAEMDV